MPMKRKENILAPNDGLKHKCMEDKSAEKYKINNLHINEL